MTTMQTTTLATLPDGSRIVAGDWREGSATCRAAYLQSADGQGETVLTGREHAGLDDAALLAEALAEMDRAGIEPEWVTLQRLDAAADAEGTIQAVDMARIAGAAQPELHTTTSVRTAALALGVPESMIDAREEG